MATIECIKGQQFKLNCCNDEIRKRAEFCTLMSIDECLSFLMIDRLINESELLSLSESEQQRHRRENLMFRDFI